MKFKNYINEENKKVADIKKELRELKSGKLTLEGKKRIEKLEDMLTKMGIFDF